MNRTKASRRARTIEFLSIGVFVTATIATLVPNIGTYLTLSLVVLGGFMMLISVMIRERIRIPTYSEGKPAQEAQQEEEALA